MLDELRLTELAPDRARDYAARDIQVLEGLEAVRRRPGMYVGSTDARGLHQLVFEIVDNSIDEALAGYCDRVEVTLHAEHDGVTVVDNGRGIPVDTMAKQRKPAVEVVMTVLHAGGKFGGRSYKVSGGLHGVGASVVNALSRFLRVEVRRDRRLHRQEYERGKPLRPLELVGPVPEGDTGTTVYFEPDEKIFETTSFDYDLVAHRLRELAFLNKRVTIMLVDERVEPRSERTFYFEGGIASFVRHLNRNKGLIVPRPIYIDRVVEDDAIEVALQYNDGFIENILTFANNINTIEGGSHLTGFRAALTSCLNKHARKVGLLKESDPPLTGEDVREGLTAVVSVKLHEPQFEGQTKTKLGNSEVRGHVESAVTDGLSEYLDENPGDAKRTIPHMIQKEKRVSHDPFRHRGLRPPRSV
jgi:DNA gyrase subunit B